MAWREGGHELTGQGWRGGRVGAAACRAHGIATHNKRTIDEALCPLSLLQTDRHFDRVPRHHATLSPQGFERSAFLGGAGRLVCPVAGAEGWGLESYSGHERVKAEKRVRVDV